ncbi:hypothetical protein [Actinocorallia longicatena]|uniref:Prevent-host-death family protein n=1 Tax=Actinocorallia longicatena TaxID=111803 RepID=A0ABP6QFL7_9ACTN
MRTAYPFSALDKDRTTVLHEVDDTDVLLERRDASNVFLVSEARYTAGRGQLREALAQLLTAARSLRVVARANVALAEEALAEDLPWLEWLPADERRTAVRELLLHMIAGASTGDLTPYARARRSWESTAIAWSDPETARVLQNPFDETAGEEIGRPGEGAE